MPIWVNVNHQKEQPSNLMVSFYFLEVESSDLLPFEINTYREFFTFLLGQVNMLVLTD